MDNYVQQNQEVALGSPDDGSIEGLLVKVDEMNRESQLHADTAAGLQPQF
jgi:hypothetical protein